MSTYEEIYRQLNPGQKQAVDTVYGPLLVLAGPGTGKTQLLTARVANILKTTDALPQNILCLTFTESGAYAMRERLRSFIGQPAYDVTISTYHAFGSAILNRYPEYFTDVRLERPVDELGKYQILADILEETAYASPIKQLRHHVGDLLATISEVKRGLLSPDDLRAIAKANLHTIETTKQAIGEALHDHVKRLPSKLDQSLPVFETILEAIEGVSAEIKSGFTAYGELAFTELETAIESATEEGKTKPLTAWKNSWLVKDDRNEYMLAGSLEARRMKALADVLERYEARLAEEGMYDFDDMIIRAVRVLEDTDELRFSLQEQYQFILLDEFQDTNAAQLRLVELLTNNPVSEGRPNVMAVGDDDQAIYAFQGAEVSNMLDFYRMYTNVEVIPLQENYRSTASILDSASNVAGQIESRLHSHFPGVHKQLLAQKAGKTQLVRRTFTSAIAERTAVADQIAELLRTGTPASEIAVLAPKHKHLEPLVPYLQSRDIAVQYEKRENILEAPVIRQLLTMSRLTLALHERNHALADSLWPEVLSYDFWDFSVKDIWELSWRANESRKPWGELLLDSPQFKHAALVFFTLAGKTETETLEYILDALIGTIDVQTHDRELPSVRSPLRTYYFEASGEQTLYETVSRLTVLRTRLREHQTGESRMLLLADLIAFVAAYDATGQQMLNTSPYSQSADAVNLMTVYKSKGLEFEHVFLVSCDDSVWGTRASGAGNKLTLPANVARIRHAGTTDDERLRLLYVAMTRAKRGLHMSSHGKTFSGKTTEPIKYFDEVADDEGIWRIGVLPDEFKQIIADDSTPPSMEALAMNWQHRHTAPDVNLQELLRERLKRYQLSPTHLTHFIDLAYGGPQSFLIGTILRFPSAPTVDIAFGNAMHETLQWLQNEMNTKGKLPGLAAAKKHINHILDNQPLTDSQRTTQVARGHAALEAYLKQANTPFKRGDMAEKSFRDEGVFVQSAHLGGKVDLLDIDKSSKTIRVIDYKTGKPGNDPAKLHRYTLQLYCYKLLVEGSHSFAGYTVTEGRLVFVEPDEKGNIIEHKVTFDATELDRVRKLLFAMWRHVMALDMPDTSSYGTSYADIKRFEDVLLNQATNSQ